MAIQTSCSNKEREKEAKNVLTCGTVVGVFVLRISALLGAHDANQPANVIGQSG